MQTRSLALSKWKNGDAPFWAISRNSSTLKHTKQIPGEVSLDLANARSKILLAPVIDRPPLTTVTLGLMGGRRIKVF
jgi:hypothetical protein